MGNWIQTNPGFLNTETNASSEGQKGIQVHLFLPPFLIPEAVRGGYSQELGRFQIEFRYAGAAEASLNEERSPDGVITMFRGKDSQRIYRILVDVDKVKADQVLLNIQRSVERVSETDSLSKGNFDAALQILRNKQHEIFQEMPKSASL